MSYTNEEYAQMAEQANKEGKLLQDVDGELKLIEMELQPDIADTIQQNLMQLAPLTPPLMLLFGNNDIVDKEDFQKAGYGLVNTSAIGAMANRVDVGHYEIVNTLGLSQEDNAVEQSKDANGNVSCFLDTPTEDENHVITIRIYKKKWDMDLCAVVAGDPIDIPKGSQISIKLVMPTQDINTDEEKPDNTNAEETTDKDDLNAMGDDEDNSLTKSVKKSKTKRNSKVQKENN